VRSEESEERGEWVTCKAATIVSVGLKLIFFFRPSTGTCTERIRLVGVEIEEEEEGEDFCVGLRDDMSAERLSDFLDPVERLMEPGELGAELGVDDSGVEG
jgi:hypothetical protein